MFYTKKIIELQKPTFSRFLVQLFFYNSAKINYFLIAILFHRAFLSFFETFFETFYPDSL